MKKKYLTIFQYLFFLGIGIFLVWWSVKDLSGNDKSQIKEALNTARYFLIFPVLAILFFSHYIRGLRWKLLIEPLGHHPHSRNAFFAVMIGYLTNLAFPRLGEVLKCTVLARYEKIPADKLIGTIIIERIIDALTLLLIFGITIVLQPGIYTRLTATLFQTREVGDKQTSGYLVLAILGGIILLCILAWMVIKRKTFSDLLRLAKKIILNIFKGLTAVVRLKKRVSFILLTVILWGLYFSGGYLAFYAFQETTRYGVKEAFTLLSVGSIGMIITPGGIGAYALLIEKTMVLYGLQKGIALAFGWLLWIFQTGVVLLGGLFSFVAMPWFNKEKIFEKI